MLFAWLFAGAHLALEHGGDLLVCHGESSHHDDHDSAPADAHHHHDLGAIRAGKAITAQKHFAALLSTPLCEQLCAQFTALLYRAAAPQEPSTFGDSPPDERASGWLLVSHTALPVRGPSLAA